MRVHGFPARFIQRFPAGTAFVYQRFPAQFIEPDANCFAIQAILSKIMVVVLDTVRVQPLAGLLHSVAVFNTV